MGWDTEEWVLASLPPGRLLVNTEQLARRLSAKWTAFP
jgi:hypothetical protein